MTGGMGVKSFNMTNTLADWLLEKNSCNNLFFLRRICSEVLQR